MSDITDERIATALERIADALEAPRAEPMLPGLLDIAQRGLDRVAASFRLDRSPDDSRLAIQDLAMELRAALESAHPKFHPGGYVGGDYTLPEMPLRGYGRLATRDEIRAFWESCDDRTCTDRDHWAPRGRINHGSTPTTCVHGQDHPDSLTCEYRCAATMPGHWCTRAEHSDDRHVWAVSDEEAQRILRAGQELGFVAEADPLDESDHRARHDWHGLHWDFDGTWLSSPGMFRRRMGELDHAFGPLTFCDCPDDAIIEAENGATD